MSSVRIFSKIYKPIQIFLSWNIFHCTYVRTIWYMNIYDNEPMVLINRFILTFCNGNYNSKNLRNNHARNTTQLAFLCDRAGEDRRRQEVKIDRGSSTRQLTRVYIPLDVTSAYSHKNYNYVTRYNNCLFNCNHLFSYKITYFIHFYLNGIHRGKKMAGKTNVT